MKQVIKNFFYNSFYQILTLIIPLITAPYLARIIGAEGVGKYSYAYSIAYFFYIFIKLGLDNYGNRTIAANRDNGEKLSHTFWSIYFMQLLFGIIFISLYVVYIFFMAKDTVAAAMLLMYVISGMLDITWYLNGVEKFKLTVTRNTIIKVLATVLIFAMVKSRDDIYVYIFIMSLSFLLSQIVVWPFIKKEITFVKVVFTDVTVHIKSNLVLFIAVLAVSLYRYMDKIMLGTIINEHEVGIYENSEKLMQIPINFVNALGIVMLPRMSYIFSNNGKSNETDNIILVSEIFASFLSSSLCLGIMGIASELVPVFYGSGYSDCITILYILMPSCLFMAFANVLRTQFLIPLKKDRIYIRAIVIGALVNLIINSFLIPNLGASGAAIGTLIAEILVCIIQAFSVRKELPIIRFLNYSMPFLMAGFLMLVGLCFIPNITGNNILNLIIKITEGAGIYIIVLTLFLWVFRKPYKVLLDSVRKNHGKR